MYLIHIYVIAAVSRVLGGKSLGYLAIFAIAWPVSMALSHLVLRDYDTPIRRLLTARFAPRRAPA
jgi:peptidoglycan/LPS O-acetylase OafA/YrhL